MTRSITERIAGRMRRIAERAAQGQRGEAPTEATAGTNPAVEALDWARTQPGWWHDSGNLGAPVLERILHHAERVGTRCSAETGCGFSTILLSNVADRHTCFTVAMGNSLERVQDAQHFNRDRVNFVIGPSQLTLPRHSFQDPLDFVLIDGTHGFPFAHLDYYFLHPQIRRGGMLLIDDIHIPTCGQLYEVLKEDKMWRHVEDVLFTAFFERTDAPLFDPHGDNWFMQGFNKKHFAYKELLVSALGEKWWEK